VASVAPMTSPIATAVASVGVAVVVVGPDSAAGVGEQSDRTSPAGLERRPLRLWKGGKEVAEAEAANDDLDGASGDRHFAGPFDCLVAIAEPFLPFPVEADQESRHGTEPLAS
jgi:hypothetical protein